MRVWTNGSFARVWVGDTIYRYREGALRVEETVKRVKGALDTSADEVAAWGPKGTRLDPALEKKRRNVLDAVALDEERVAAVISEGRSGPRLVIGPPAALEQDLALKGREATKIAWPDDVLFGGPAPWSKDDKPSGATNRGVRVTTSPHGVAVAAGSSGHLFLYRHGADDLACALRVPGNDDARLEAVATKQGLLVTLSVKGADSRVAHLAEDGTILGLWPSDTSAMACFPAVLVGDDKALAYDDQTSALALLSLPDLSELGREPLADAPVEAAAAPKSGTVILADGTSVFEVTIDEESISVDGPYLLADAKQANKDELDEAGGSYEPSRATGPAQIAFPAGKKLPKEPPWEVAMGKDTAIAMRLRSGSGAGKGIRVEVSGAAVKDALVRPILARVDRHTAELVAEGGVLVAVLPDLELPQGVDWPLDPKPTKDDEKDQAQAILDTTHFDLELVLRGEATGNGLLTVAVSAEGSSSAPLKRTRPVTVA